jgi:hypothetical protein
MNTTEQPEGLAVPVPLVTPVVLLSDCMDIVFDTSINTNNINKTLTAYKTRESNDEPNLVFTRTSQWTLQHRIKYVKTCN